MTLRIEHRTSPRERQSDAVLWRCEGSKEYNTGWLLETSEEGFAFAWRSDFAPPVGTVIDTVFSGTEGKPEDSVQHAVIRRVQRCHEDLCVFGAQMLWLRPIGSASEPIPEPKLGAHCTQPLPLAA